MRPIPGSPTEAFELTVDDLTYPQNLIDLGAQNGWLPSGLPNGNADPISREQLVFLRGSTGNGDDRTNLADVQFIVNFIFLGGPHPNPLMSADVNDDNRINIADAIYLVQFLFLNGTPPLAPYAEPGQDLTF